MLEKKSSKLITNAVILGEQITLSFFIRNAETETKLLKFNIWCGSFCVNERWMNIHRVTKKNILREFSTFFLRSILAAKFLIGITIYTFLQQFYDNTEPDIPPKTRTTWKNKLEAEIIRSMIWFQNINMQPLWCNTINIILIVML